MENHFRQIASLIGDPVRATILWTLLDGKAFTATELAMAADTSAQNLSMHLNKLTTAGWLYVEKQGRHRYYRFARKEIAYAVEALASLSPAPEGVTVKPDHNGIKYCRTCYDHLAGKVGVLITGSLLKQKLVVETGNAFELSAKGRKWVADFGIPVEELQQQRRPLVRPCLDWSERQHHIAGALGAALLDEMLSADWLRRTKHSRAIVVTAKGRKKIYEHFKLWV